MDREPTLRDIAERAGVSANTVSLALRNSPRVSEATRRKIGSLAEELGYVPNPLVSALFQQRRRQKQLPRQASVAVLDPFRSADQPGSYPLLSLIENGLQEQFTRSGYSVDRFYYSDWRDDPQRLLRVLRNRGIYGLVFLHFQEPDVKLDWDLSDFAMAAMGFSLTKPSLHRAVENVSEGMTLALEKVSEYGYRKPGLIIDYQGSRRQQDRHESRLLLWQSRHPERVAIPPFSQFQWEKDFLPDLAQWFDRHQPDCLLCPHRGLVYGLASSRRLRIPEDLGYVHLNVGADQQEDYSGIWINPIPLGQALADLVIGQLNRNERGIPKHPKTVIMPVSWHEGTTLPRRH